MDYRKGDCLAIDYEDAKGDRTRRTVRLISGIMVSSKGEIFVTTEDRKRQDVRSYRIDRIRSAKNVSGLLNVGVNGAWGFTPYGIEE